MRTTWGAFGLAIVVVGCMGAEAPDRSRAGATESAWEWMEAPATAPIAEAPAPVMAPVDAQPAAAPPPPPAAPVIASAEWTCSFDCCSTDERNRIAAVEMRNVEGTYVVIARDFALDGLTSNLQTTCARLSNQVGLDWTACKFRQHISPEEQGALIPVTSVCRLGTGGA